MEPITIGGAIVVLVLAVGGFIAAYFNSSTRLMKRVDELTTRVFALQDDQAKCKSENADLKAEVLRLTKRTTALESATGTVAPAPLAGIAIADLKGTIREFSPALTPIFGYLPKELVGRPITALVPPELVAQHEAAFAKAAADPTLIDREREILTYGLSKNGERVAIAITMSGWKVDHEGLITATIRQRAQVPKEQSRP